MSPSSKTNILIFLLYLSLLFGFYFGEDSLGGAFGDYQSHSHISEKFTNNFLGTLLNYDQLGHRHSPIFYIIKSFLINDEIFKRLIFLHFYILIPLFFYKSLKIKFKTTQKNYLKLLSSFLFLFPTIRSYSIWPDPHLLGVVFFTISIFYFLKFKYSEKNNYRNCILNTIFLAISAYCSPNFGIFVIFYLISFLKKYGIGKKIAIVVSINILLSLPFFYYLFFLDINFIFNKSGWDIGNNIFTLSNFANKFIIVNSLFLFYFIPLFFCNFLKDNLKTLFKANLYILISLLIIFVFLCINFEFESVYLLTNSGGGFFYNFSKLLFNNNIILFLISFLGFVILTSSFFNNYLNVVLYLVIIFSNPQLTLWQANYSPSIFIIIFLLLELKFKINIASNKSIINIFIFFCIYLIANIILKNGINLNKMIFIT